MYVTDELVSPVIFYIYIFWENYDWSFPPTDSKAGRRRRRRHRVMNRILFEKRKKKKEKRKKKTAKKKHACHRLALFYLHSQASDTKKTDHNFLKRK